MTVYEYYETGKNKPYSTYTTGSFGNALGYLLALSDDGKTETRTISEVQLMCAGVWGVDVLIEDGETECWIIKRVD